MHEHNIGVLGGGRVGTAAAAVLARAVRAVVLVDPAALQARHAVERARALYRAELAAGRMDEDDVRTVPTRIEPGAALEDLRGCGIIVEALETDLDRTRGLLHHLEALVEPDALLVTTSFEATLEEIAVGMLHPERLVGMNLPEPVLSNPLVELVEAVGSDRRLLERLRRLVRVLGKVPVNAPNRPGLVADRLRMSAALAGLSLLQRRKASIADIDEACRRYLGGNDGMFAWMNRKGPEQVLELCRRLHVTMERFAPPAALEQQARAGIPWPQGGTASPAPTAACEQELLDAVLSEARQLLERDGLSRGDLRRVTALGLGWQEPLKRPLTDSPFLSPPGEEPRVERFNQGGTAVLTINASDQGAALDGPMARELGEVLAGALADPDVTGVVLAGSGPTFLDTPAPDVLLPAIESGAVTELLLEPCRDLIGLIIDADRPIVAALHGAAHGLGAEVLLACDAVVVAPAARWSLPWSGLGLMPLLGSCGRLVERLGLPLTRHVLLTDEILDARAMVACGLAVELVVPGRLLSTAARRTRQPEPAVSPPTDPRWELLRRLWTPERAESLVRGEPILDADPQVLEVAEWAQMRVASFSALAQGSVLSLLRSEDVNQADEARAVDRLLRGSEVIEGLRARIEGRKPEFQL